MNVRDVKRIIVLAEVLDTRIGSLSRYTQNPFLLLPPEMPMVTVWNALLLTRPYVDILFGSIIAKRLSSVCGFSSIDDVIKLYQLHLQPEYGGIFGTTWIDNDLSDVIRDKLLDYHWTAEQIALEYDRQHVPHANAVRSDDKVLDSVVNDILVRHGKGAAIAYLLGLKSQQQE
jgi:hypothetical protein